jgi:hypothetical protein
LILKSQRNYESEQREYKFIAKYKIRSMYSKTVQVSTDHGDRILNLT